MPFRAYFIDQHEHVRGAVDLDAISAAAALAEVRHLAADQIVELWEIGRHDHLVHRLEPSISNSRGSAFGPSGAEARP